MDLLLEFFRHNTMMNQRLLETCGRLSPEQLAASATGTYGTVGATLVHVANSQRSYAARVLGTERPERLTEEPFPGLNALIEQFERGDAELEAAAQASALDRPVELVDDDPPAVWTMPVGLVLLQAINHGTEHRSQVATILTQLGVEPPRMDGWTYFEESGQLVQT